MKQVKKGFSRRDLIKGLGVAGILPFTQVEQLMAQQSAAPVRMLFVALQHGWGLSGTSNRSMSGRAGDDFAFPDGLDPFNSIKQHCTVVDGLMTLGEWGNNHDLSYADIFTAGVPQGLKSSSFDKHMPLSMTPSLDFLLQQKSGREALRLCAGYRSWGVRYHPLSFGNNSDILPFYTKASDAYNSVFKDLPEVSGPAAGSSNVGANEAQLIQEALAFIQGSAEQKQGRLSNNEKEKLDRYIKAVEHVRSKNTATVGYSGSERLETVPNENQNSVADLDNYLEMVKVAFANNLTNSAVLGIGDIFSITDFHHVHAHANTDTYWGTRRDFAQKIVKLANDLDQIVDFDGSSLLDNTIIVLAGEVGDGRHNVVSKGHILVGGSNHLRTGRLINVPTVRRPDLLEFRREDINGALKSTIEWATVGSDRTNADLLRELGNIAGLNLTEFGLSSLNKGDVLT